VYVDVHIHTHLLNIYTHIRCTNTAAEMYEFYEINKPTNKKCSRQQINNKSKL